MAFTIEKLDPKLSFGQLVTGLSASDIENVEVQERLRAAWVRYGLIVFKGSAVTPDFQLALSRVFGELELHPVPELRDAAYPELMNLTASAENEGVYDLNGKRVVAYLPWHSDLTFVDRINHGGLLTARSISRWGGETGFIDQIDAYDRLPEALKRELAGVEIVYQLTIRREEMRYGVKGSVRTVQPGSIERKVGPRIAENYPPVVHPAVFVQPETGRKVLNISPVGAQYILGQDDAAGHALLGRLVDHIMDCPAYYHSWRPSEMLLWDNWRMLHCVTGAAPEDVRKMQRTTILGDYGVGRKLHGIAEASP